MLDILKPLTMTLVTACEGFALASGLSAFVHVPASLASPRNVSSERRKRSRHSGQLPLASRLSTRRDTTSQSVSWKRVCQRDTQLFLPVATSLNARKQTLSTELIVVSHRFEMDENIWKPSFSPCARMGLEPSPSRWLVPGKSGTFWSFGLTLSLSENNESCVTWPFVTTHLDVLNLSFLKLQHRFAHTALRR